MLIGAFPSCEVPLDYFKGFSVNNRLVRISKNKEASSDGEALVKAAAEVGFPLTMDDLERKQAENEELSDHDLEMVSGGTTSSDTFCWVDYSCDYIYRTEWNDQSESGQTHTKFG